MSQNAQGSGDYGSTAVRCAIVLAGLSFLPFVGLLTVPAALWYTLAALNVRRLRKAQAVLLMAVPMVVSVAWIAAVGVALRHARQQGDESTCRANLGTLGTSIHLYMGERGSPTMPADLSEAISHLDASLLDCPSGPAKQGHGSDYFYLPGPVGDPDAIIACERGSYHRGRRHVLMADFDVDLLGEDAFQRMLARPENERFRAAWTYEQSK